MTRDDTRKCRRGRHVYRHRHITARYYGKQAGLTDLGRQMDRQQKGAMKKKAEETRGYEE